MTLQKSIDLTNKLLVTKTTYTIEPDYSHSGAKPIRHRLSTTGTTLKNQVGSSCSLPDGNKITITDTGVLINDAIPIELSPRRRTGGRLISETVSINIRPAKNDSAVDQLLAQGYPLSRVDSSKRSQI